jgi:hypothetical protein
MDYFTSAFIVPILASLYFLFFAVATRTKNIQSAIIFKYIPAILAFVLGLLAFKVI